MRIPATQSLCGLSEFRTMANTRSPMGQTLPIITLATSHLPPLHTYWLYITILIELYFRWSTLLSWVYIQRVQTCFWNYFLFRLFFFGSAVPSVSLAICKILELVAAISTVLATFWSLNLCFHSICNILVLKLFMLYDVGWCFATRGPLGFV